MTASAGTVTSWRSPIVEQHLFRVRLWSLCKRVGEVGVKVVGPGPVDEVGENVFFSGHRSLSISLAASGGAEDAQLVGEGVPMGCGPPN